MRTKKAFALSMAILISAILMLATIYLLSVYKKSVKGGFELSSKLEAELLSDSTVERLKFYAKTGKFEKNYIDGELKGFPKRVFLDGRTQRVDSNITLHLRAGGSLNSFYSVNMKAFEQMLYSVTKKQENYKAPFLDWIDIDKNIRLGGAEESYYKLMRKKYEPSNRGAVQHPEELFLIRGFLDINSSCQKEIIDSFHYINFSTINPNVIVPDDISKFVAISDFEYQQLKVLYAQDYDRYVERVKGILNKYGYTEIYGASQQMIIGTISVTYKDSVVRRNIEILTRYAYGMPFITYRNSLKN